MLDVLIRDRALRVRIGETPLHHDVKREFSHDFIVRTIVRLFLNEPSKIFLSSRHGLVPPNIFMLP